MRHDETGLRQLAGQDPQQVEQLGAGVDAEPSLLAGAAQRNLERSPGRKATSMSDFRVCPHSPRDE
jgi:hypothetical protein